MPQWFQTQVADFYDTGFKSWSRGMTNASIPKINILKNCPELSVSVPINLFIKLDFVSVNGHRETYFVNAPRIWSLGHHHQSVLPKGRSFTANSGTKVAVLLGINRCSCFLQKI